MMSLFFVILMSGQKSIIRKKRAKTIYFLTCSLSREDNFVSVLQFNTIPILGLRTAGTLIQLMMITYSLYGQ